MVKFEKVLDAIVRFFNDEIAPGMNDWQEVGARMAIGRVYDNQTAIVSKLSSNGVIRAFSIMDAEGNVDAERLLVDLRKEVERKGKLQISIPVFGKFTFTSGDVDKLRRLITEG